jgi:regulator of protease activity HflC (stomatin/prohibitin superfamily)
MNILTAAPIVAAVVLLALSARVVKQDERCVLFRLGRVVGVREPGLRLIIPIIDVMRRSTVRFRQAAQRMPDQRRRRSGNQSSSKNI